MHLMTLTRIARGWVVLIVAVMMSASPLASAARIADQVFDDRIRLGDSELQLNGVGLRSVLWLKGYAAGLYLPEKAPDSARVLVQKGPKRIQMKMLLDVEAKEFTKAFAVGIRRNTTEAEQAVMKDRMAQFDQVIAGIGKVKKGDVVSLDFIPGQGLITSLNGRPRGPAIAGEDLYGGILKIFLGDHPVDKALKAGLLGGSTDLGTSGQKS